MTTDETDPPPPAALDSLDEVMIEEAELAPQNPDAPPNFRELIVLALKTTQEDLVSAAEECFVGRYPSTHAFIVQQVSEHLPDFLQWIGECLDPDLTRAYYEGSSLILWTIPLGTGDVLVFQSFRDRGAIAFSVPSKDGARITAYGLSGR